MASINLEKLVFLEMTNKIIPALPDENYLQTYSLLTEDEKKYHGIISKQIHDIWTAINTNSIPGVYEKIADSIIEYDEKIEKVNEEIMKCHDDFGLTLKNQISPTFKKSVIKILGKAFFDKHFGK